MNRWSDPQTARKILTSYTRFAVVGCSSQPYRASNSVSRYLIANGYEVVPVNPAEDEVLGLKCYPDLVSIPEPIEVVDIFRRSELVGPHVDEAIEIGAKAIWMQLDVIDVAAAERAAAAGLDVVMDRCPAIDHPAMVASKS
ncbi:MAG TPA: CoA-binding protein [Actinomycetota bacterium]|nr:CoA-binding protein [Actinomycetota bacterium]